MGQNDTFAPVVVEVLGHFSCCPWSWHLCQQLHIYTTCIWKVWDWRAKMTILYALIWCW